MSAMRPRGPLSVVAGALVAGVLVSNVPLRAQAPAPAAAAP